MDTRSSLLRPVVAVPARNEAKRLPTLLSALAQQTWVSATNQPLDVVVVLNNCHDHSAEIVKVASTRYDGVRLHVVDVWFPLPWAHVGSARRLAMDRAFNIGGPHSVLFSTDADATPAVDWIDASLRVIRSGADLVGGNIIGDKGEKAQLGKGFMRRATRHLEYARLVDCLTSLIDPDPCDPWPRRRDWDCRPSSAPCSPPRREVHRICRVAEPERALCGHSQMGAGTWRYSPGLRSSTQACAGRPCRRQCTAELFGLTDDRPTAARRATRRRLREQAWPHA
jgi:hypothetical protein